MRLWKNKLIRLEHIPEVLSTGLFIDSVFKRVITNYNDESTFAVSYTCESMKKLHEYEVTWSKNFKKTYFKIEKKVFFRTIFEEIEKF